MTVLRALVWLLALASSACAAAARPAFDPRFPDDDAAHLTALVAELRADAPAVAGPARLAAIVHTPAPALVLADLDQGRVLWRVAVEADSRPELLGDLVLIAERGEAVAYDATSGRARWRLQLEGLRHLGAARVGDTLLLVATVAETDRRAAGRVRAVDARSGRVVWSHEVADTPGRPVATKAHFLVPWQRRHLSVLDASEGRERLRLRARDHVVEWVEADTGGVLFGERDAVRLDAGYDGTLARSRHYTLPLDSLPGRPLPHASAYTPWPAAPSAHARIAVHVAPAVGAPDRFYLVFYRAVLAFDGAGVLAWAELFDDDVVSASAAPQGLLAATERGRVLRLDAASGALVPLLALGTPIASGTLDVPTGARSAPIARDEQALRKSLLALAIDSDSRLLPVRIFAVEHLATLADPDATRDLLDVYAQRNAPPGLRRAVADALSARRLGTEHLVDALLARYDFLEQTREAPLAVIVPALVARTERRAVPRLVERMRDHATPLAVLPTVVSAVVELGGAAEVAPLLELVRRYRADSAFAAAPDALLAAARGVVRHGDDRDLAALRDIAQSPRTSTTLAASLRTLLAPPVEGPPPELAERAVAPPAPPLRRLTREHIRAAFVDHVDDLRACVLEALTRDPTLLQVRLAFLVESDGSAHAWSFVPNDAQFADCLYPRLRSVRFPRFRADRQIATFTIAVREDSQNPEASEAPLASEATWWASAAARAAADGERSYPSRIARPWWQLPDISFIRIDAPPAGADPQAEARPAVIPMPSPSPSLPLPPGPTPSPTASPTSRPAPPPQAEENGAAAEDRWWLPVEPAAPSAPSTAVPQTP